MDKIRFFLDGELYDANVSQVTEHVVAIKMTAVVTKEIYTSGFDVLNEHNMKIMAVYEDYVTEYRKLEDGTIQLSNDGSIYVPPVPEPVDIEVSVNWDDNDNEDNIRPNYVMVTLYADGVKVSSKKLNDNNSWKHTFEQVAGGKEYVATFSEVDKYTIQGTFNVIYYHQPISQTRANKIRSIDDQASQAIYAGTDVELSTGVVEHYNFTEHVQTNIITAYNTAVALVQAGQPSMTVPFYDSNNICVLYLPADILTIYFAMGILITEYVTLAHQLQEQIEVMTDADAINAIEYKLSELDAEHLAKYNQMVKAAQDAVDILSQGMLS